MPEAAEVEVTPIAGNTSIDSIDLESGHSDTITSIGQYSRVQSTHVVDTDGQPRLQSLDALLYSPFFSFRFFRRAYWPVRF